MKEEKTIEEIEKEQEKEIIQAIENNRLYDLICCKYWEWSNDLQIRLLKELAYINEIRGDENKEGDKMELIENLKETF